MMDMTKSAKNAKNFVKCTASNVRRMIRGRTTSLSEPSGWQMFWRNENAERDRAISTGTPAPAACRASRPAWRFHRS